MREVKPPQAIDVLEDELEEVHSKFDNNWRHGGTQIVVYHRDEDDTYWMFSYRVSTDGEFNGLRDGEYFVLQVVPKEVTTTVYVPA